jgi:DNA-binding transcriptional ArsR family regulator
MPEKNIKNQPRLLWDAGTAYELFISLEVLHTPERYGLRASWAAGIRSRIPAGERKLLEELAPFVGASILWVHQLPEPKDAIAAMWSMRQIPAAERMVKVLGIEQNCNEYTKILLRIARQGSWNETDLEELSNMMASEHKVNLKKEAITHFLDLWCKQAELGDGYLAALQAYYQVFFEEEEKRIGPVLKEQLELAKELATRMSVAELLVKLSQGLRMDEFEAARELVLIPAYWSTPLIMYDKCDGDRMLLLFGARPANMSAIPGEIIPESLLRSLKALSDPTRLKIMHYLYREEVTPSELARRLHLRAPTVTHHLNELRLAGLVNLTIKGQEKLYAARQESIQAACDQLKAFMDNRSPV